MVVIRFARPRGIDYQYMLTTVKDSFMSRANTIAVPDGKMELAILLIQALACSAKTSVAAVRASERPALMAAEFDRRYQRNQSLVFKSRRFVNAADLLPRQASALRHLLHLVFDM